MADITDQGLPSHITCSHNLSFFDLTNFFNATTYYLSCVRCYSNCFTCIISFNSLTIYLVIFPVGQMVKNLPATQETRVRSLGWEDPLEKGMAIHSSILAWRIPWTEELAGHSSWGRKESDTTEWLTLPLLLLIYLVRQVFPFSTCGHWESDAKSHKWKGLSWHSKPSSLYFYASLQPASTNWVGLAHNM